MQGCGNRYVMPMGQTPGPDGTAGADIDKPRIDQSQAQRRALETLGAGLQRLGKCDDVIEDGIGRQRTQVDASGVGMYGFIIAVEDRAFQSGRIVGNSQGMTGLGVDGQALLTARTALVGVSLFQKNPAIQQGADTAGNL